MKINEIILLEAAYDGMIVSMKRAFPDYASSIDQQEKWAKEVLRKADRVVWYYRIIQATLADMRDGSNTADVLYGNYPERDLYDLQDKLLHYYGSNIPDINNYRFDKQTVETVFSAFNNYEDKWRTKQNLSKPIVPEEGDYALITFPEDGSAWWYVNRGYCPEEGRSGGHCGNINGKYNTDERILSYRDKSGHVILTFVLLPDGYLGEMKAKNNQKPSEKYHNVIMSLLLSDTVLGIKGAGYLPEMNFSIFDLDEKNINIIISNKQSLITDQISATPVEFLKAPSIIKANPKYQQLAVSYLPSLSPLLSSDSNESWEDAIEMNPDLIINAPNTLDYFRERVIDRLTDNPKLILQSPKNIGRDPKLLREVVAIKPDALAYIVATTPNYKELAIIAINKQASVLKFVPIDFRDYDICMTAVKKQGTLVALVPKTIPEYYDICLEAVKNHDEALVAIRQPTDPNDFAIYKKICSIAVQKHGDSLYSVPHKLIDYDMCMAAVKNRGTAIRFVPYQELFDKSSNEKYKALFLAAVKQDPKALQLIPPNNRDYDVCFEAVKQNHNVLQYVPDKLQDEIVDALYWNKNNPPTDDLSRIKELTEKLNIGTRVL